MPQPTQPIKILVAPLDWGLGHTIRCIPIIKYLQQKGCQIYVAASNHQKSLLLQHFEGLEYLEAPFVNVRYGSSYFATVWQYFTMVPKLLKSFKNEQKWLQEKQVQYNFDVVISDNRYGMSSKNCTSIFLTHQLAPIIPFAKGIAQKYLYKYINQFTECWVLDEQGRHALAPLLSSPKLLPNVTTRYIGIVSRLQKLNSMTKKYNACFILSGPEPQRSILEQQILATLPAEGQFVLVRGSRQILHKSLPSNIEVINMADTTIIEQLAQSSEYVMSRSGYTSIMDWMYIGVKAIVVPTPAQYEQEYLGNYLHSKKLMMQVLQKDFNTAKALIAAQRFQFEQPYNYTQEKLFSYLDELLAK